MPDNLYNNDPRKEQVLNVPIKMVQDIDPDAMYTVVQKSTKQPILFDTGVNLIEQYETDSWLELINNPTVFMPGMYYHVKKLLPSGEWEYVWSQPCIPPRHRPMPTTNQPQNLGDEIDGTRINPQPNTYNTYYPAQQTDPAMLFDKLQEVMAQSTSQYQAQSNQVLGSLQMELENSRTQYQLLSQNYHDLLEQLRNSESMHMDATRKLQEEHYAEKLKLSQDLEQERAKNAKLESELANERWKNTMTQQFNEQKMTLEKQMQKREREVEDSNSLGLKDLMPMLSALPALMGKGVPPPTMSGIPPQMPRQPQMTPEQMQMARMRMAQQQQAQQQNQAQAQPNIEYEDSDDYEEEGEY